MVIVFENYFFIICRSQFQNDILLITMKNEVNPTNTENEYNKGRLALWLDHDDLQWLSQHCCCPGDANQEQKDLCARLRFRASAALHKAGLKE